MSIKYQVSSVEATLFLNVRTIFVLLFSRNDLNGNVVESGDEEEPIGLPGCLLCGHFAPQFQQLCYSEVRDLQTAMSDGCFSAVYVVFLGILVIVHRLWFSRVDSVRLVLIQYVVSLGPGKYVGRHAKGGKTCAVKYVGPTVPN